MIMPRPTKFVPLSEQPLPRVVLIDFNLAYLVDHPRYAWAAPKWKLASLPINLLEIWWSRIASEYAEWLPKWYEEDEKQKNEWLLRQFKRKEANEYASLRRNHRFDPKLIE